MTSNGPLDEVTAEAERDLEAALRGSSLCSVSRRPGQGVSDVKIKEGRWYTLRDVQRGMDQGRSAEEAIRDASELIRQRTPAGEAWAGYREGAEAALSDARLCLGLAPEA